MKQGDEKLLIDIPKWDKHQRPLKQAGKRQRDWIALSTNIMHDPDFFTLNLQSRMLWLCLLLHAGRVGVPFELSPSSARVLFKFKHSCDFQPLIDQGFITLLQDKTRQTYIYQGDATPVAVDNLPQDADYTPRDGMDRFAEKPEFNPRECPPKFQPKPETLAKIREHHPDLTDEDFEVGLKQMKAYVYGRDVLDWNRAYQNWMNGYQRKPASKRLVKPVTDSEWLQFAADHGIRTKGKTYNQIWSEVLNKQGAAA